MYNSYFKYLNASFDYESDIRFVSIEQDQCLVYNWSITVHCSH